MADAANDALPVLSARSPKRLARAACASLVAMSLAGCMSLTPQLHPTDVEALEQIEDREEREQAYEDNLIKRADDARGTRYVKGNRIGARPRNWQSLDLVLRSDRNSAAALPEKKIRAARVLSAMMIASAIVMVGGFSASAREGLDLSRLNGTGAVLLTGGALTVGFAIGAGVLWGQARQGYEDAVEVYNESLGLRLGLYDADGDYVPPEGVLVNEEGFIILDQKELSVPQMRGEPEPEAPVSNPPLVFPGQEQGAAEGPPPAEEPAPEPESEDGKEAAEEPAGDTTSSEDPSEAGHARAPGLLGPARATVSPSP